MKKALLILGVAVLALSSCKKEKTCTCTETAADGTTESTAYVIKGQNKHLKDECGSRVETTAQTVDGENVGFYNCTLD